MLQLLLDARVAGVTGAPGIGKSHLAGTVASRLQGAGVVVSLAGCTDHADVVRAIGDAVGVFPAGDEAAVRSAVGSSWLLADDVSPVTTQALLGLDLPGVLLLVGDVGDAVETFDVGPLDPDAIDAIAPGIATGNPLLAKLAVALGCELDDIAERLAALRPLSGLPMGLGVRVDLAAPQLAFRPDPRDRRVLRAGVAALLGGTEQEGADWVRDVLRERPARAEALAAAAYGAPAEGIPDPRDVLLLRLLAKRLSDAPGDRLGVLSSAVGARLALRSGQVGEARALLRVRPTNAPADAGLLRWIDGDALLALGDLPGAQAAWASAEEHLLRGRLEARAEGRTERWGVVELLLASAEQLALRGYEGFAGGFLGRARSLAREAGDGPGVAATWAASAGLAAAMGEGVSAEQFAAEVVEPVRQGELVRVALAAQAGRVADGLRLLEGARGDEGLALANRVRRRAELHLRDGSYGRATRAAREAAAGYASVGEHVSSAQALRLAADAAALAGHLEEAANLYLAVLALQVRLQDLAGLQATLLRAARVDDARGATESATLRREQAEAVARARGVGE